MLFCKEIFRSELGKEIWERYYKFLDDAPKNERKARPFIPDLSLDDRLQDEAADNNLKKDEMPIKIKAQKKCEDAAAADKVPAKSIDNDFKKLYYKDERTVCEKREAPKIDDMVMHQGSNLSLYDITRYFKNSGVVGEEALSIGITLAVINGIHFGVEGFSGSGKTFVVEKLMDMMPDGWVYKHELSSKNAIFYESEKINGHKIIFIPELQKAMQDKKSPIIEVIKNITEGNDASRVVTNSSKKGTTEYLVKAGKEVIFTLALENYFKKDEETSRRFMCFQTDSSKEHLDEIHSYKARKRFEIDPEQKNSGKLKKRLQDHIVAVSGMKDIKVFDPCSEYFKDIIPKTQKSVGYVDHYYNLVDACVKFHYQNREKFEIEGLTYIVANVEDHFNIFNIYFRDFTKTLKGFADRMPEGKEKEEALEELVDVKDPNWTECLGKAIQIMSEDPYLQSIREEYPNMIENWHSRQNNNGLTTIDYKTGKNIVINGLADKSCEDRINDNKESNAEFAI